MTMPVRDWMCFCRTAIIAATLLLSISALAVSACADEEQNSDSTIGTETVGEAGNDGRAGHTDSGERGDQAVRLTDSAPPSSQNPVFSPDGEFIVFTRFLEGYNLGPSELVKMRADGTGEQVIVPADEFSNVNVPYGSWVGNKICFSSDRGDASDEIWIVNDDGSGLTQVSFHDEETETYYIEPVFNPRDPGKIVFEHVTGDDDLEAVHRIALLDVDSVAVTMLTDGSFDDRLPSWSSDGSMILFQRNERGRDEGWMIYVADIDTGSATPLSNLRTISDGNSDDTDCSWGRDGRYVLTSSNRGGLEAPNIFLFPIDTGSTPLRVTFSDFNEEGAPSQSPDGEWIAFESHPGEDEEEPSDILIIRTPQQEG